MPQSDVTLSKGCHQLECITCQNHSISCLTNININCQPCRDCRSLSTLHKGGLNLMSNKPPMLPNQLQSVLGNWLWWCCVPGNLIQCLPNPTPPPRNIYARSYCLTARSALFCIPFWEKCAILEDICLSATDHLQATPAVQVSVHPIAIFIFEKHPSTCTTNTQGCPDPS